MPRREREGMESRWAGSRTEAFSDGVFAIAVTLLVLDLHVPESAMNDLLHGIVHQWPNYLAYATSFITIGGIWLAHHAIFRRLRYVNTQVMWSEPAAPDDRLVPTLPDRAGGPGGAR